MAVQINDKEIIPLEISTKDKKRLEKIALVKGVSLNEYLLEIALNEAEKIENHLISEEINLSDKDWDIVISSIENPSVINPKLRKAIERYQKEYQ
ncbi:DUF1778 domain-containing protein [Dolichospermum circinale CS-534/05]|uniref:type II toxin-antitoxin system TacA family antitoxin n=1 Tax=Dolichospermum circinale TaxID=109265 RepID=UPI00232EF6BD|nr:DUF1778 domain-containing protein [Dolichospermum circinale]MDB9452959.1 DUF1778 domain-containing protein [Dolichospermum circinale CS-541/06]MDB9461924.1 DUF1778 domain-containing protein [Dolichospermum circinale CS-541/04]MDB9490457.1 DUF1778 domain-containing protein [Dolichospermum circinale CS-534/05]MDB9546848.1 DUF1778 domain-containing protein [Dolichospermum circinale CS-1031]